MCSVVENSNGLYKKHDQEIYKDKIKIIQNHQYHLHINVRANITIFSIMV